MSRDLVGMLPYHQAAMAAVAAAAMDYGPQRTSAAVQPAPGQPFPHSWFVQADLCVPFKHNQNLLEPGILELRKEKSRDAARSRRGKENYEFYELAKMLPLPAAITSQLDKASIIRLTISYLKLRDFSGHGDPPWAREQPSSKNVKGVRSRTPGNIAMEIFEQHQGTHILQSLDGFAFALATDGRFLYISETVSIYLGLSQVEMTGSSIFDYVHHQDHGEVAEQLGMGLAASQGAPIASPGSAAGSEEGANSSTGTNHDACVCLVSTMMSLNSSTMYKGLERTFCIRMKSTLTKRGCHFKSSGYRVVLLLCRLRPQYQFSHSRKGSPPLLGMVSLAIALPPPSVHEIRLETDMFVVRLTLDFRIAHCEPRIADLLDYTAEELTGMNLYTLCHGEDAHRLRKSHVDLINKGQVMTHYYRLMNKNGGYTWVQTCATIVCSSKNSDEQNVICVNYVLSGREYENLIMDCCQLEEHIPAQKVKREETGNNDPENPSPGSQSPEGRAGGGRETGERMGEERSPEGTGEGSRSLLDQQHPIVPTQLHPPDHQMSAMMSRPMKKIERRGQKRKGEEESSCCSSEDEERVARKRYSVLSPASSSCQSSGLAGSPKPPVEDSDAAGPTSVKDLEQAMTKHLPTLDKVQQPTDFSTDTLLKAQQQRTTIQWIGAHHHHQQAPLPASTLLRQLYANRESVIRANVRPATGYYPDVNAGGTLPTPPGDSFDQFGQKAAEFTGLYPGSYEYHSMTPPSSVSPRDKAPPSHYEPSAYTEVLRHQYLADPLPLKPQPYIDPYPAPPMDNSQFYGPNPYLYHNKTPAPTPSYPDPLKNPANWYSTPS